MTIFLIFVFVVFFICCLDKIDIKLFYLYQIRSLSTVTKKKKKKIIKNILKKFKKNCGCVCVCLCKIK